MGSEMCIRDRLDGSPKYPFLTSLVKICLTLSYGNADVERSFSENKLILDEKRTRMTDETLNGYRATSSYMKQFDNDPSKLSITGPLLNAARKSRKNYENRLLEKKKATLKAADEKKEKESLKRKQTDEMKLIEKDLEHADDLHKEGMTLLQTALDAKDFAKVHAANAILQRSVDLKQNAEEKKSKIASTQKGPQPKKKKG